MDGKGENFPYKSTYPVPTQQRKRKIIKNFFGKFPVIAYNDFIKAGRRRGVPPQMTDLPGVTIPGCLPRQNNIKKK